MDAPPNIHPVTAHSDRDVLHWLTNDTRDERLLDNIFAELCIRLQRAGIPVKRATLYLMILHPQWLGSRIMWADGMREAKLRRVDYDVKQRSGDPRQAPRNPSVHLILRFVVSPVRGRTCETPSGPFPCSERPANVSLGPSPLPQP